MIGRKRRNVMVNEARHALEKGWLVASNGSRIAAVKVLVADIVHSRDFIRKLLRDFSSKEKYELHFTLFCWLDREDLPADSQLRRDVLSFITEYLMTVKRESAYASWMAGDLLGDHWKTPTAIDALCRGAAKARHPAGRKGSIHGLQQAYSWISESARVRVQKLITRISRSDASSSVREYAQFVLNRLSR
jgi:hypothetical protein